MKIKKVIISLCLLFAYTVGVSHNIIPHCHHNEGLVEPVSRNSSNHNHQHNHHQHTTDNVTDHEHVAHNGHFDEGLIDFIFCLFTESDHPDFSNIHYFIPAPSGKYSKNLVLKIKFPASIPGTITNKSEFETHFTFNSESTIFPLSPPLLNTSYRGPPSYS